MDDDEPPLKPWHTGLPLVEVLARIVESRKAVARQLKPNLRIVGPLAGPGRSRQGSEPDRPS
jgi:hypothetical protein